MTDDSLLSSLGAIAREQQARERRALDADWDALSHDTLDPDRRAQLEQAAARNDDAQATFDAFRPLGVAFEHRMTETVRRDLVETRQRARRHGWQRALAFAAVLAVAVSLFYVLGRSGQPGALPDYALEAEGGIRTDRSATAAPLHLTPESRLRLVLRPSTAVDGAVATRLFLRAPDGTVHAWPFGLRHEADPQGAVRLESDMTADRMPPSGSYHLVAAIGREHQLPDADDLMAHTQGHWQILETEIRFERIP